MGKISSYEIDETNFDYEQYKKDISELNELTARILKNNPSCVKGYRLEPDCSVTEVDYSDRSKKTVKPGEKPHDISALQKMILENCEDTPGRDCVLDSLNKSKEKSKGFVSCFNEIPNYEKLGRSPMMSGDQVLNEMKIRSDNDIWKQFDGNKFVFDNEYHEKQAQRLKESLKRDPKFQKEIDKSLDLKLFGGEYVGKKLSKDIIEKSKENVGDNMPPIAKDLQKLGLYGVYSISDNKFNAAYLDFVLNEGDSVKATDPINKFPDDLANASIPTIEVRLFNAVGRMKDRLIPLTNTRIDIGIKDFINDEFLKKVRELADKNIEDSNTKLKTELVVDSSSDNRNKDSNTKICNRISMISNYIQVKSRRGPATFILASKKNIDLIVEASSGHWRNDGKTFKYNKTSDHFNFDLVANNDLGDTVIVGRTPKESEVGINLVINKNTLTNFEYSDDDISGINLSFDFYAFGQHPEWSYFSFDLKS